MESQVMWEPDTKRNTHMDRFRAAVASSCGLRLGELWGDSRGCAGPGVGVRPIHGLISSRCPWAQSCGRDALPEPRPEASGAASAAVKVPTDGKGK